MRCWLASILVLVGGCDGVFGLAALHDPEPDAPAADPDAFVNTSGCADGQRDGFLDLGATPNIAGCAGGWSIAGVATAPEAECTTTGDDSTNPDGTGCSMANLCAPGWHICATSFDVRQHIDGAACSWTAGSAVDLEFYASAQPGSFSNCSDTGEDDLFGCGSTGGELTGAALTGCAPLARTSGNICNELPSSWDCTPAADNTLEARNVRKTSALGGGALCCKDPRA